MRALQPCPACGASVETGSAFCSLCGRKIASREPGEEIRCPVHPEFRAIRPCPRCGTFACGRCLTLTGSGEEVCAACHARSPDEPLPWDLREELGTLKAFWLTSWKLITAPTATFASAPRDAPLSSSVLFCGLASFASMLTTSLFYAGIGLFAGGTNLAMTGVFLGYLLAMPLLGIASLFGVGAIDHLLLTLVRAKPASFSVTIRASALSCAPYLVGLVPVCGFYVFPLWSAVLKVLAYRGMHRTSAPKAAVAALWPAALMGLAMVLVFLSSLSALER